MPARYRLFADTTHGFFDLGAVILGANAAAFVPEGLGRSFVVVPKTGRDAVARSVDGDRGA